MIFNQPLLYDTYSKGFLLLFLIVLLFVHCIIVSHCIFDFIFWTFYLLFVFILLFVWVLAAVFAVVCVFYEVCYLGLTRKGIFQFKGVLLWQRKGLMYFKWRVVFHWQAATIIFIVCICLPLNMGGYYVIF